MPYEKSKIEKYNNSGGINEKISRYLTDPNQFLDLRNYGFERPGALVSRPGTADYASLSSATYLTNPRGMVQYRRDSGASQILFDVASRLYDLAGPTVVGTSLTPNATTGYGIDYAIAGNVLYYCNGYTFQRYDASFSCWYNIPQQRVFVIGAGLTFNQSLPAWSGATQVIPAGKFEFRYALKKGVAGVSGIVGERAPDDADVGINVPFLSVSLTATLVVTTGQWYVYGFTIPPGYGVSSIVPYLEFPGGGVSYIAGPTPVAFQYADFGGITLWTVGFDHFASPADWENQFNFTLIPSYIDLYKNMLFMSGISSVPSTVWFSNLGEFERLQEENFIEVRTGNNDKIQNMVVFQDSLVVFKNKSIHEIKGDSPDTLSLKDVTLNYGCVNNHAAVQFQNKLWFMDEKGICEYNGPDTFVVSYSIEQKLNEVDKRTCRAIHVKKRNEVWFCCGSKCFIYDYDVNSWTIYDSLPIESAKAGAVIEFPDGSIDVGYFNTGTSFINMTRFGDTLCTDRGSAITLLAKTPYHKVEGESTQEMWRRLYVDAGTSAGTTLGLTVNFRQDYGESIVSTRTITLDSFQERIDFGISAKTLSVEWIISSSQRVTINGYALEARFLRST